MRIAVLLLTVLCALGIYMLLDPFGAGPSAPSDGPRADHGGTPSTDDPERPELGQTGSIDRERETVPADDGRDPVGAPDDTAGPASAEEPGQDPNEPTTEGPPPNVLVRVRDAVTGGDVPTFSVSLDLSRRFEGADGELALYLPPDTRQELRIEAPDCVPTAHVVTVPSGVANWEEAVYLEPSAPFSGVEITAVDPVGKPVDHLNVAVWKLARRGGERPSRPIWSRRGSGPTGRYRLPDLEPGSYFLEFRALDETGAPRPLRSHEEEIQVLGGDLVPVQVAFRPGVLLRLRAEDPQGTPQGDEVQIRIVDPQGERLPQVWIAVDADEPAAAVDRLSTTGDHVLRTALEPGRYTLEAWVADERVDSKDLDLWQPGEHRVTVVVSRRQP